MGCAAIAPGGVFLTGVLDYVDCQAQTVGQGGYQALAAPGSMVSLALTGLLTIFVALFGFRMMFGHVPSVREGVVAVAKIGVVLLLATSWPAFRVLAYDVVLHGPAELVSSIGARSDLVGSDGGLTARLQGVDNGLIELATLGTGKPPNAEEVVGPTQPLTPAQQQQQLQHLKQLQDRPRWDPARDTTLVGEGRIVYLAGVIAAFASVRLIAGLLLAVAPLFALFLLFDATRGLFAGWVRGLTGAALGAVATAVVLGSEVALMEPWLAGVLSQRREGVPMPSVPVELLVMTLAFSLTLLAVLVASAWIAHGFHIPEALRSAPGQFIEAMGGRDRFRVAERPGQAGASLDRGRALGIADAVTATRLRENSVPIGGSRITPGGGLGMALSRDSLGAGRGPTTTRQPTQHRTRRRVSAQAGRRDGQA